MSHTASWLLASLYVARAEAKRFATRVFGKKVCEAELIAIMITDVQQDRLFSREGSAVDFECCSTTSL